MIRKFSVKKSGTQSISDPPIQVGVIDAHDTTEDREEVIQKVESWLYKEKPFD